MRATGTGIENDTFVIAFTGTTVTLSRTPLGAISSATLVTFNYDGIVDNNSIAVGQSVNVSGFALNAGN
jgi:hypothetical protein